jgi:succinate dehydrogenase / fumarate reductase cytochrome b subunit
MADRPNALLNPDSFLLRRLHSLTGVLPIGVFLIFHLTTNGSVFWGMFDARKKVYGDPGVATFQHEVDFIHSTPFLLLVEVMGLWLPLAFHSLLGVYYAVNGKSNVSRYAYQDNWRYTWQRLTGYIGILFVFWHVATLRWGWSGLLPMNWGLKDGVLPSLWNGEHAASSMAMIMQQSTEGMTTRGLIVTALYAIGVLALVFHFANGLWTAAITWGLTVSQAAQRRWGLVCVGVFAGLMVMGWGSTFKFATMNYKDARATELKVHEAHGDSETGRTVHGRGEAKSVVESTRP